MTTLTAPDEPRAATASPPGPRLRLRRAGRADRMVELRDGKKWTIGSSPRCQVQLPAAEAQPLQCLVSLEEGAAVVTRWAAGVLLNGREFSKQLLSAGDLLAIGPWEIEWQAAKSPLRTRSRGMSSEATPTAPAPEFLAETQAPVAPKLEPRPPSPATAATLPQSAPSAPAANGKTHAATAVPRPVAKTVLVSSRLTEAFDDLLGPAKPLAATAAAGSGQGAFVLHFTAAEFQDRLVTSLWMANFTGRRRARALVQAVREARTRVVEMTTALSALESQVAATRSASDASVAELQTQLESQRQGLAEAKANRDRLAREFDALQTAAARTAPPDSRLQSLAEEVKAARQEATTLREQLEACEQQFTILREQAAAAESARAAAEKALADQRTATRPSAVDLSAERAAWEQQHAAAAAEAAALRDQVQVCQSELEAVRQAAAEADAARSAIQQQLEALQIQQRQWLAECQTLESQRVEAMAETVAERDELHRRLAELTAAPLAAVTPEPAAETNREPSATRQNPFDGEASTPQPGPAEPTSPTTWQGWEAADPEIEAPEALAVASPTWDAPASPAAGTGSTSLPSNPVADRDPASDLAPTPAPFAPTSFIDKYRHLLDEDGDSEPEPSPRLSRPLLDEEYLSSKRGELPPGPAEDSDEALEAYMSNLMRRVRSGPPAGATTAASTPSSTAAAFLQDPPRPAGAEPELSAPETGAPEIELDANGMLRLTRKHSVNTDLSALRELANSTARTAIAHHRQRRHNQSAVSKGIICALASGVSTYLLLTAPEPASPWFWCGCVTLVFAVASGAQLALLAWQRLTDRSQAPVRSIPDAHALATGAPLDG